MPIEAQKRLAVGTVTYNNSRRQLTGLVQSLAAAARRVNEAFNVRVDFIAIDNGGPSGIADLCRPYTSTQFSCELLEHRGNLGFAASTNILAQRAFAADTDWFVTINPDGMLERNCLSELLGLQHPDQMYLAEAKQFPEEHPKVYSPSTGLTQWATGACLLVPKVVFQQLHGFDPNFFMYVEDVDFSWRARAAGARIIHRPGALFAHSVIGRAHNPEQQTQMLKSALYLGQKWSASDFVQWCGNELLKRSLATADEVQAITVANDARLKLAENTVYAPPTEHSFRPDFAHFLSFSQTRWS